MAGGGVEGWDRLTTRAWNPAPRGRSRAILAAAPLVALALSACTSLLAGPPSSIFDLTAPGEVQAPGGALQLLVPEPTTVRALDTDRIAARPTPAQYAYLPGAVWSDRLPKLLQARLVETLQNSGHVRAAAVPGQGLLIDYQIVMDVRAFELTAEGAVADFAVRIMDDRNGRIMRSRVFRVVVPVQSSNPGVVVQALDYAMDQAYVDIVNWALS
jgi:cholesterol transport system auxiliary component